MLGTSGDRHGSALLGERRLLVPDFAGNFAEEKEAIKAANMARECLVGVVWVRNKKNSYCIYQEGEKAEMCLGLRICY